MPAPEPQSAESQVSPYRGSNLSLAECDALAVQHIDKRLYAVETGLFNKKWFDYRFLHPVKSTYLFAQVYFESFGRAMQVRFDVDRGPDMRPVKGSDPEEIFSLAKMHSTGFWKARQAADLVGCPYPVYCNSVMRWAEERNWTYLPKPSQLYTTEIVDFMHFYWDAMKSIQVILPTDPFYKLDRWRSHVYQRDFQMYLLELVSKRTKPAYLLNRLLYRDKVLDIDIAIERFGAEFVVACKTIDNCSD